MNGFPFDIIEEIPAIPAGTDTYIHVPTPPDGFLTKFLVAQVSGTLSGFSATLYNSMLADPARSGSLDDSGNGPVPQLFYQVLPTVTVAGGESTGSMGGAVYPYCNKDHDPLGRGRYLVLKIRSVAAGNFAVAIGGVNSSTA